MKKLEKMKSQKIEKMSDGKLEKITGGEQTGGNVPSHACFDTGTFLWSDYKCDYDVNGKVYGTIGA